jgi:hypothetical protein
MLSLLALMYILVEVEVNRYDLHSRAYLWTTPAWLLWYVFARASTREPAAVPVAAPTMS